MKRGCRSGNHARKNARETLHSADFVQGDNNCENRERKLTTILAYHSGVGDVIHTVIMKNNGIDSILTFDEKEDFKSIPALTVLHPRDVKLDG